MIAYLRQRYTDFIREGAIRAAGDDVIKYALRGNKLKEHAAYSEMLACLFICPLPCVAVCVLFRCGYNTPIFGLVKHRVTNTAYLTPPN